MIAPLTLPVVYLAESVSQAANSWPAVALAVIGLIGTLGTLIIKVWAEGRKNGATGDTVKEIKDEVSPAGGGDAQNMYAKVDEGLQLMKFAVGHIKNLPTSDDIKRLDGRIDLLGKRVAAIEQGRAPST